MSHDCPLMISDDHQLPPSSGTLEQLEVADACGGVTTILTRAQLEQAEMQAGIALEMLAIPVDRQGKALPEDQMQRLLAKRDEMRSSVGMYSVSMKRPLPRTNCSMCMMGVPSGASSLHGHWMLPSSSSRS